MQNESQLSVPLSQKATFSQCRRVVCKCTNKRLQIVTICHHHLALGQAAAYNFQQSAHTYELIACINFFGTTGVLW